MKKKIIKNEVLCWYDLYLLSGTIEELDKFVSKEIGQDVSTWEWYDAMHYYVPRKSFICMYDDWEKTIWVALHELNHFIQRMLKYLSIPEWVENTELVSNLWEYYWEKVLEFYSLIRK